ncbi:SDR family NAD(P)-dependent oxidoreductase [Marinicaulis aureus]|uniref:SDR family NAD(P)-dependent oxidoreductase n=1 Tax=Hyphococcus aureus TaxID=2666033 RepID=A0ABW1KYG2_9PROT
MANISLENQVAIVTGAGKGLGRVYALALAVRGAKIVVNNRRHSDEDKSSADATVDAIRAAGGEAVANYDSVEDSKAGDNLVAQAMDQFGRIDIVIPNAGVARYGALHDVGEDIFRECMEINYFGALRLAGAALPHMRASKYGRIVMCISTGGLFPCASVGAYGASKAAVVSFMKALAQEEAPNGIGVNGIAPYASTAMLGTLPLLTAEQGNLIKPEAVAPVLVWLASPACKKAGEIIITGGGAFKAAAGPTQGKTKFVGAPGEAPTVEEVDAVADDLLRMEEPEPGGDVLKALVDFVRDIEKKRAC